MKVLLVDDDYRNIFAMSALLERGKAEVVVAESGAEALSALETEPDVDIVLMDIMMPGMDGYEAIRAIREIATFVNLPIIAITGKSTAGERQRCLDAGANDYVPKPVDGAALLTAIERWVPTTGPAQQPSSVSLVTPDAWPEAVPLVPSPDRRNLLDDRAIDGRQILIVDDDYRNLFALSALLERGHADILTAESGPDALAELERSPNVDVVLMDIMMPGMDGYETMEKIREIEAFKSLPIIAVTGKVMAGERQRCLDAGASDYVPKPVDTAELIAALRPWLPVPARTA